jgi:hypothetical protein
MKKFIAILAMGLMLIACGGNNSKKSEGSTESKQCAQENCTEANCLESKAVYFTSSLLEAYESGDEEAFVKIAEEMGPWTESLSEEENEKSSAAVKEWLMAQPEEKQLLFLQMMEELSELE